jgi:hypothetical protein
MTAPKPVCPECKTSSGFIRWVDDPRGEAFGHWVECQRAWHDKDRDPYRYGYPDEARE